MTTSLRLLVVAVTVLVASCSSSSAVQPTTTALGAATVDTSAPATSTSLVVATSTTSAPAPTVGTRPRPTTTVDRTPRLSSVSVSAPPGQTCVLGTSTTTVLLWSSEYAAGARIYSTTYGDLGQFPAEVGSAEVPFECDGGSTIFSLTPIAEGGAAGQRVDLEVPSYMT